MDASERSIYASVAVAKSVAIKPVITAGPEHMGQHFQDGRMHNDLVHAQQEVLVHATPGGVKIVEIGTSFSPL
jgi:hypothetical protein